MTPFCPFCLLENVLPAIGDYKNASAGYKARCPAHEDRRPSLSIDKAKDNTVLLKCHAGFSTRRWSRPDHPGFVSALAETSRKPGKMGVSATATHKDNAKFSRF